MCVHFVHNNVTIAVLVHFLHYFLLLCRSALLFVIRFGLSTIFLSNYTVDSAYILSYINRCIFITPSQAYIVMNCYSHLFIPFIIFSQHRRRQRTTLYTHLTYISINSFRGSCSGTIHCILITF